MPQKLSHLVLAACATFALAGAAQAMTVAEFLGRIDALKAKGPLALFSPEIGVLKAEGKSAAEVWHAQAHRPNACPAKGDKIALSQDDFMAMMQAVPPQQREQLSVAQAVTRGMNKRYPCPA
ncbi:hypothetical protein [Sphingomonas bacterium]|uniref:hypothetical protein n=1 Tax=Sphingomonas bacterium TaxID=1895847 RepID=UPI0015765CC8|nr:hypothetical protein [Sphingomonas bacterium]